MNVEECRSCKHFAIKSDDGSHCYMFEEPPKGDCMQHSKYGSIRQILGPRAALLCLMSEGLGVQL